MNGQEFSIACPIHTFNSPYNLSGEISLWDTLDREQRDDYPLVAYAIDDGTLRLTGSVVVNISLKYINDNTPAYIPANLVATS